MSYLAILALATFFFWDCFLRPLLGWACDKAGIPAAAASYLKAVLAFAVAHVLDRWAPHDFLLTAAAASLAGTLLMLRHSRDGQNISTVIRGRARRGMPMPGP